MVIPMLSGGLDPFCSFGKIGGIMLALAVLQVIPYDLVLLGFKGCLTSGI